jgi:flagellar hook-length control protein FliK
MAPKLPTLLPNLPAPRPAPLARTVVEAAPPQPTARSSFRRDLREELQAEASPAPDRAERARSAEPRSREDAAQDTSESAGAENRREERDRALESGADAPVDFLKESSVESAAEPTSDTITAAVAVPAGPSGDSAARRSVGGSADVASGAGASDQPGVGDPASGDADDPSGATASIGALTDGDAGLASTGAAISGTSGSAGTMVDAAASMAVGVAEASSAGEAVNAGAQRQAADTRAVQAAAAESRASLDGSGVNNPDRAGSRAADSASAASASATTPRSASTGSPGSTASDPLARLIEQAKPIIERTQTAPAADAVAGRLAEVEGGIARSRVQQSVEQGRVAIGASDESAASSPSTIAATAVPPGAARDGSTASGGFGGGNAGTAFAGPAADLASALADGESHPAAQLAAKGVGLLANQRGGAITMRLEPPALGALRIELMVRQGAVVADFTAATPEARVLLEANLGMLRERLESQGLSVERISVHGGRGTESAASATAQGGGDARQEGAGARSDGGERGERSGTRQDAAGGESRGRRDGEPRGGRERTDAQRQEGPRGFAATLTGESAQRTEPKRRAG